MTILFVCTGNTCRSPMAAAMLIDMLRGRGINNINVKSAGIMANVGQPASLNSLGALKEKDIDFSGHKATQVDEGLLKEADLILTMTEVHKFNLQAIAPFTYNKTFTLNEYARLPRKDIYDPFGGPLDVYKKTLREIELALEKIIDKLIEKNKL